MAHPENKPLEKEEQPTFTFTLVLPGDWTGAASLISAKSTQFYKTNVTV
ncbi:MAG TPA: hypothetical protein VGM63_08135 [Mucilaginibacter sp.]|jgi:hypothetical protein